MRVLVTRPSAQAGETAAKLAALGHEAIFAPVIDIVPTGAAWPRAALDLLAATSGRAFAYFAAEEFPPPEMRRLLPLFLVGEKTLAAARRAGFEGPAQTAATVQDLIPRLVAQARRHAHLLYLAGRDRKSALEEACANAGLKLTVLETYAAKAAQEFDDPAAAALHAGTVDAVLHYSHRSAVLFLQLMEAGEADPAPLRHVAISEEAAAPLRARNLPRIDVAPRPDEDSMLKRLVREDGTK